MLNSLKQDGPGSFGVKPVSCTLAALTGDFEILFGNPSYGRYPRFTFRRQSSINDNRAGMKNLTAKCGNFSSIPLARRPALVVYCAHGAAAAYPGNSEEEMVLMDPRLACQRDIARGRSNLLLMLALTLVNMVLLAVNADISFPFSAFFPQAALLFGGAVAEELGENLFLIIGIALGVAALMLYLLCWLLSKKHPGWLTAACILFILDTLVLAWFCVQGFSASFIVDILFHAWVLYYLVRGMIGVVRLRRLPPAPPWEAGAPGLSPSYAPPYAPPPAYPYGQGGAPYGQIPGGWEAPPVSQASPAAAEEAPRADVPPPQEAVQAQEDFSSAQGGVPVPPPVTYTPPGAETPEDAERN